MVGERALRAAAVGAISGALAGRRGAASMEYGLVAALIAVAVLASTFRIGPGLTSLFGGVDRLAAETAAKVP